MKDFVYIDWTKPDDIRVEWPKREPRRQTDQIKRLLRENRNLKIACAILALGSFAAPWAFAGHVEPQACADLLRKLAPASDSSAGDTSKEG